MSTTTNQLTAVTNVRAFVFGGKAVFTLVSGKTGTRFTYRVRAADRDRFFFVDLLVGEENDSDYRFCGTISTDAHGDWIYRTSLNALDWVNVESPSQLAMKWFTRRLNKNRNIDPEVLEFWASTRCSACNRQLTVPTSIERGMGPKCFARSTAKLEARA